ncbi:MAG TPA: ROK family protein [Candidatus Obscuribacterales bacterium]
MTSSNSIEGHNLDSMLKNKMPALGIDLGGTKISAAPVADFKLLEKARIVPTPKGPENIIQAMLDLIAEAQKDHILCGVGIATAGIVNTETGEVIGSTGNLPGWAGTPIKTVIEQKTGLSVHVENDANAAAYGDVRAKFLAAKTCVIALTFGTGIGGGIVFKGELYRGAHYAGGEVGHMKVGLTNHRLCTCGLFDCWEAYGSGRGFRGTAKEILATVMPEQSRLAGLTDVTVEAVIEEAEKGDIIAQRILNLWHEHLAIGIVSLAHTLDPDCFIVSGGMSKFIDYDLLREMVADRTLPRVGERLDIHNSALGTEAGIIGAAHIVLDRVLDR